MKTVQPRGQTIDLQLIKMLHFKELPLEWLLILKCNNWKREQQKGWKKGSTPAACWLSWHAEVKLGNISCHFHIELHFFYTYTRRYRWILL